MAKCLYADEIVCCVVTLHASCYFFHYITSSTPNKTADNVFLIQRVNDLNIQSVNLVNISGFKVEIVDRQHIIVHDILEVAVNFISRQRSYDFKLLSMRSIVTVTAAIDEM